MTRFELPEVGLSRTARWCLVLGFLLLVLVLLWVSYAPSRYEQGPPVDLAVARMPEADYPYDVFEDALILSMTRDGRIWRGREPLDRLGEALEQAVLTFDDERRAEGKSGFEDFPGGGRGSRLRVVLRIDRAAPWGAVHRTLQRLGQSSIFGVYFLADNEGRGLTRLPSFLPTADQEYAHVTARVRREGTSVEGCDLPDLTMALKTAFRAVREGDRPAAGLIDADANVPFGEVVRALDAFACAGIAGVDLAAGSVRAVVVPRR